MNRAFTYYGSVRGQGRPRTRLMGRTAVIYKADVDREYEWMIQWAYQAKYGNEEPIQGAFGIQIKAVLEPPKSASKKRQAQMLQGYINPTTKPDTDNVVKAVLDALNGIAFEDDKNCISINAMKVYGTDERIEVILTYGEDEKDGIFDQTSSPQ